MRMMLKVQIPVETGNEAITSGQLPAVIKKTMEKLKPEAAYFFPQDGERGCIMVFDMQDVSQLPVITEPFFKELNAAIEVFPVMNVEDLMKGLSQISK
jgi:hypothetical protein